MIENTVKRNSDKRTKKTKQTLVSAQVPPEMFDGINEWLAKHPEIENNQSIFARMAFKEKLTRDGIKI